MRCVKKVSRLKLDLPWQKWTMSEKLIFFEIWGDFKEYWDLSCIYPDKKEQWMIC